MEIVSEKMNSDMYLTVLSRNLHESADILGLGNDFIFQQDNASCYLPEKVKRFFEINRVEALY